MSFLRSCPSAAAINRWIAGCQHLCHLNHQVGVNPSGADWSAGRASRAVLKAIGFDILTTFN
jgi:hypothetical protein